MKQIAKTIGEGTFWLSFNSFFLKGVSLVSILVTLSRLNIYEYGLVQLTYSSLGVFGLFVLPGLSNMVLADIGVAKSSGESGEMKKIFSDYFKIQMVLGVIAWAIMFFGSEIVAEYYKGQISLLLKIISFSFLVSPFRAMYSLLFAVNFKFFYQSLFTLIEESLKVSLIFFTFYVFQMRAEGVIFAAMFSQILVLLIFLPAFWGLRSSIVNAVSNNSRPFWHILYKHGKWSVFHNYVHNLGQHVRIFLIKIFVGTEAVGIFSVAQGLISNIISLFPLSQTVTPILSQYSANTKNLLHLAYKSVKYQIAGFVFLGFVAWFAVPPFIMFFFPKYASSLPIFKIMLLNLIPMGYASITTLYHVFKIQKMLLALELVRILSIVVFLPLFALMFGIYGLAIETVVTVCIFVLVRNYALSKKIPEFRLSLKYLLSIDEYDRIIIVRIREYLRNKLRFLNI